MNAKIKIVHEISKDEPYLILHKPPFLPSAPLKASDESALTEAVNLFPELKNVSGKKNIEYGLVHRIDTETEGLLLIAATQDFYDYITNEQKENRFIKKYAAVCKNNFYADESFPPFKDKIILNEKYLVRSQFRPYGIKGKEVRPVTEDSFTAARKKAGPKIYTTEITLRENLLNNFNDSFYAECKITEGYRHQVRCHLRWIGFPVAGDKIYGDDFQERMYFFATGLEFNNPYTNKKCNFNLDISNLI